MNFKTYLSSKGYSESSIKSYDQDLFKYKEWLQLESINEEEVSSKEVLSYLKYCKQKGYSKKSLSMQINSIRKYYNYKEVEPNPCLQIKIQGIKKRLPSGLLSELELSKLYDSYPLKSSWDYRDKLMLSFIVYQGLRKGELLQLKLNDVHYVKDDLCFLEVNGVRRSAYRRLELLADQIGLLKYYQLEIRPKLIGQIKEKNEDLLVSSGKQKGRRSLENALNHIMRVLRKNHEYFKDANQIRASRIVLWLQENNLRQVQYMAGHKYISSTERYQLENVEELKRELDKYHPMLRNNK